MSGADVDYNGQPAGYAGGPSRRSPTSTPTTTRRCSTSSSTSFPVDFDGRSGPDEHRRAGHHGAGPEPVVLAPGPICCARSRSTATPSTPVTGSTGSTGRRPTRRGAPGSPAGRQRVEVGLHAPAARRPGAGTGAGRPRRGDHRGRRTAEDPLLVAAVPARFRRPGQERVGFPIKGPDQTPGVITMTIDDRGAGDLDRRWRASSSCSTPPRTRRPRLCPPWPAPHELHPVRGRRRGRRREDGDVRRGHGHVHRAGADGRRLRRHLILTQLRPVREHNRYGSVPSL